MDSDDLKFVNYIANKGKPVYNMTDDMVEYNGRYYFKTFSYLSDRSKAYNDIISYLDHHNVPYKIEVNYSKYYISKGKIVWDKKLMFTIKIAS
jgi:hypothetical protein